MDWVSFFLKNKVFDESKIICNRCSKNKTDTPLQDISKNKTDISKANEKLGSDEYFSKAKYP